MGTMRMDHVGIMVSNMDASIRFYTEVVGLRLKDRLTHTNGVIELAFLGLGADGETELELIQGYNDKLPAEGKVHHAAFASDDVEAEFRRLKGMEGVRLIDADITTLPNGYRYFFFYGPDGEWIEFFQRK